MDKSIVVWQPERAAYASSEAKDTSEDEGIWEPALRLGEIGGKALGFYGAALAPDLSYVIAYGYQGGLYLWRAPWTRTFSGPQLVSVWLCNWCTIAVGPHRIWPCRFSPIPSQCLPLPLLTI